MRAHRDEARYESGAANRAGVGWGGSFEGPCGVCVLSDRHLTALCHNNPDYAEQMHCHPKTDQPLPLSWCRGESWVTERQPSATVFGQDSRTASTASNKTLAVLTRFVNLPVTGVKAPLHNLPSTCLGICLVAGFDCTFFRIIHITGELPAVHRQ